MKMSIESYYFKFVTSEMGFFDRDDAFENKVR